MSTYTEYFVPESYHYCDMYEREQPDEHNSIGLTEEKMDHVKDHFLAVILHLYGEGKLDADGLEFSLGEMAYTLGMELPANMITVKREAQTKVESDIDFAASLARAFV